MSLLPRSLRRLPLAWWLTTGTIAVVVGFLVTTALAKSSAAAARYDSPQPVLVLTHDVAAGAAITAADVRPESWPKSFLPASPTVTSLNGSVAVVPLTAGEALTQAKVGAAGLSPTAALLHPGERGVAIANSSSMPKLVLGDWVDVVASVSSPSAREPAAVIATDARVIAVDEQVTTIAVAQEDATRVTFASSKNAATLTLTAPQNAGTAEITTDDR